MPVKRRLAKAHAELSQGERILPFRRAWSA